MFIAWIKGHIPTFSINFYDNGQYKFIFPKPFRKLRANPEYIEWAKTKSKALVSNLTGKHVACSLGGAAVTIAVPNAMQLRGRSNVMGTRNRQMG